MSSEVEKALLSDPVDIDTIFKEANERGLPDEYRARCWLLLMHIDTVDETVDLDHETHKEEDLVSKDVARSMWSWAGCDHPNQKRVKYREQLQSIINSVLRENKDLHYYQGYHDIATVLLMCTQNVYQARALLKRISTSYLRECMNSSLNEVIQELALLMPLIRLEDSELADYIEQSQTEPYFAVPWVLTWFAHNLENDPKRLFRLFDFFLTSHPFQPLYFSAALAILNREAILSVECHMSDVHGALVNLPKYITVDSLEEVIEKSRDLVTRYPPGQLEARLPEGTRLADDSKFLDFPYPWMEKTSHLFQPRSSESFFSRNVVVSTVKDFFTNQWSTEQVVFVAAIAGLVAVSAIALKKS